MTHADNKVEWCIKKAQKELAEGKIHRGLVKINSNPTLAFDHLRKAEHNLRAAIFFRENGYSDWSASAFFYCLYHCFLSIALNYGYESRNQDCTIAVVEMLREQGMIKFDQQFIEMVMMTASKEMNLMAIRENFQYGTKTSFDDGSDFEKLRLRCVEALEQVRDIIT